MKYVATIGLEVHAQIRTTSKMFCGCRTDASQAMPNTNVCPVCLGLPGSLPVPNRQAIEMAAMTGLALHSTITRDSVISRKNYFYPDLPSSYQRSQYEDPLCVGGYVEFPTTDGMRRIELTRIHIEEDTGKLTHMPDGSSLIDYNRAGVPLMEIVSEPVIASAEEARLYFQTLHQLLSWIGVNSGNLEEGALRCDANVSVRPEGQKEFGAKVEIKNVNSFRNVERAINYEIERQIDVLTNGGRIIQSTRGWNDATGKTIEQRTKEFAHDYRYFPDPDIPPLQMESAYVQSIGARLPELPIARYQRFMTQYALSAKDAESLTITREVADFYEATVTASVAVGGSARDASVWIIGEFFRLLNDRGERIADASARMTPQHIAGVIALLNKGTITRASAKEVFEECYNNGTMPDAVVATRGLAVIGDSDALLKMARDAVAANPKAVADYKAGKDASIKFLVGQIMKVSRGQASPQAAEAALVTALNEVKRMEQLVLGPFQRAHGEITLPGSKSISNRVLLLSALATGTTRLKGLLDADDTRVMRAALTTLGITLTADGADWLVHGGAGRFPTAHADLFMGNAGTAIRPLTAALALLGGDYRLHGVPRMHERPIGDLVDGLRMIGAIVDYEQHSGFPPIRVGRGQIHTDQAIAVRGDVSSQFLTALLLALPLVARTSITINVISELISKPYVALTIKLMERFGVTVSHQHWQQFVIAGTPQAPYHSPGTLWVEGDASSASYFLAAGAIAGGPVRVHGVGQHSIQGDVAFVDAIRQMGARVDMGENWIEVAGVSHADGRLRGIHIDCLAIPDAAMTLAVMALFATGKTTLTGIGSWRVKETDRIAAMHHELVKVGASVASGADWMSIEAPVQWQAPAHGVDTYDDHRMAMCFSLVSFAGIAIPINEPGCVAKTFPSYFSAFAQLTQ